MTVTNEEWIELVEWVNTRYPDRPWRAEQAVAYFYDLEEMSIGDVWSGLFALYEAGRAFAPTGSELLAATREAARRAAREEHYRTGGRALPEEAYDPKAEVTWAEFSTRRFGEELTPGEVIARMHASRTDCRSTTCDIHQPTRGTRT